MEKNEYYNDKINGVRLVYIRSKFDLELTNDTLFALKLEILILLQEL
jgi:hypothetical protein